MRLYTKEYITYIIKIIMTNLDKNNQNNTSLLSIFRRYMELLNILFKNEH